MTSTRGVVIYFATAAIVGIAVLSLFAVVEDEALSVDDVVGTLIVAAVMSVAHVHGWFRRSR